MGTFGGDGSISGILTSAEEASLNANLLRWSEVAGANRLRTDGMRWVPKVNGEFKIPVVSIHTLGDLYLPWHMEQTYRRRTVAKGNGDWLVQRAIRAPQSL